MLKHSHALPQMSAVEVDGKLQRFCMQCSKWHPVDEVGSLALWSRQGLAGGSGQPCSQLVLLYSVGLLFTAGWRDWAKGRGSLCVRLPDRGPSQADKAARLAAQFS